MSIYMYFKSKSEFNTVWHTVFQILVGILVIVLFLFSTKQSISLEAF
jgi:hypothetical protein